MSWFCFWGKSQGLRFLITLTSLIHPLVNISHCFRGLRAIIPDSKKNCELLSSPWSGKGLWRAIDLTHLSLELSGLQQKTPAHPPPSCTMVFSLLPVITGQRLLTVCERTGIFGRSRSENGQRWQSRPSPVMSLSLLFAILLLQCLYSRPQKALW